MRALMARKNVTLVMVQIDEAHTNLWPIGLDHQPLPQASMEDRISRAKEFVKTTITPSVTSTTEGAGGAVDMSTPIVLCDQWDNAFGNLLQAWPDVYYLIDASTLTVLARSTYGSRAEALLDVDCVDVLYSL
jgi:hypothetical protein